MIAGRMVERKDKRLEKRDTKENLQNANKKNLFLREGTIINRYFTSSLYRDPS